MLYFIIGNIFNNSGKLVGHRVCTLKLSLYDIQRVLRDKNYIDKSFFFSDLCLYVQSIGGKYYEDITLKEFAEFKKCHKDISIWKSKDNKVPELVIDNNNSVRLKEKSKHYIVIFKDTSCGVHSKDRHSYMILDFEGHIRVWSYAKLSNSLKKYENPYSISNYLCANANLSNYGSSIVVHDAYEIFDLIKEEEKKWKENFNRYTQKYHKEINKAVAEDSSISETLDLFSGDLPRDNEFNKRLKKYIAMLSDEFYTFHVYSEQSPSIDRGYVNFVKHAENILSKGSNFIGFVDPIVGTVDAVKTLIDFMSENRYLDKKAKERLSEYYTSENRLLLQYYYNFVCYDYKKMKLSVPALKPLEYVYESNRDLSRFIEGIRKKQSKNKKISTIDIKMYKCISSEGKNLLDKDLLQLLEVAYFSAWYYINLNSMGKELDISKSEVFVSDNYTVKSKSPSFKREVKLLYGAWEQKIFKDLCQYVIESELSGERNEAKKKKVFANLDILFEIMSEYYPTPTCRVTVKPHIEKVLLDDEMCEVSSFSEK